MKTNQSSTSRFCVTLWCDDGQHLIFFFQQRNDETLNKDWTDLRAQYDKGTLVCVFLLRGVTVVIQK